MDALIIGLGNMGTRRLRLLERRYRLAGVEPRPSPELVPVYSSLEALQRFRSVPERVFICTPPETHGALLRRVLGAGARRVFVEKPLAYAPAAVEGLELRGAEVRVGGNWRYAPFYAALRRRLQEGGWERLRLEAYAFPQTWPACTYPRLGGVLYEMLPHSLYIVEYVTGEELRTLSAAAPLEIGAGRPDRVRLTGTLSGGRAVTLECAWLPGRREDFVEVSVDGEKRHLITAHEGPQSIERETLAFMQGEAAGISFRDALRHIRLIYALLSPGARQLIT